MLKMHLRQPGFTYSACWAFTKNKERIKNLKNKRSKIYLSKLNTKSLFSTWYGLWRLKILKIQTEEQLLIKYYVIEFLILLKIQKLMDIKEVLL